jgi:spermidine synthase
VASAQSAALAAAFVWGAVGATVQALLLSTTGLATGFGMALPLGLSAWFAGFALGAALSSRLDTGVRTLVLFLGALLPYVALEVLLGLGARGATATSAGLACSALVAVAVPQGLWFAPLVKAHGRLAWLWSADLLGAITGLVWLVDRGLAAWSLRGSMGAATALGLLAVALTLHALRRPSQLAPSEAVQAARGVWRWSLVAACGAAAVVAFEVVVARLSAVTLGGLQPAHNATLLAVQLALFAGALLLPRVLPRDGRALAWTAALAAVGALLLPLVNAALPATRAADALGLLPHALAYAGLLLLGAGALLPLVARAAGEARTALWLTAEGVGALLAGPFVVLVCVPWLSLSGVLAFGVVAVGCAALLAAPRQRVAQGAALGCVVAAIVCATRPSPVLSSPPYRNGAWQVLSYAEDREYAVAVIADGVEGERTLLTDSFRAAGTGPDYRYMQALGHLPMLLHPAARDVGVLALGTGTTLGAVSLHARAQSIEVLELSAAVVEQAPYFSANNHDALRQTERVRVALGDGRATLARGRSYDVLTMEPLLPDAPGAVYLYTSEFYALARAALRSDGLLVQWVPTHALEPGVYDALLDTFAAAFPEALAFVAGTQTILVGANGPLRVHHAAFVGDGALRAELEALGLADGASVQAACVGRLQVRSGSRLVSDRDPWIVHAPRRSGARLLADLPANLGSLRERCMPVDLGASGESGARAKVRLARERFGRELYSLLDSSHAEGARYEDLDWRAAMAEARTLDPLDAELRAFEQEVRFTIGLREGVSILLTRQGADSGREALPSLLDAAEVRPQRADVHAWVAVALDRAGSRAADAAFAKALQLCPGLARTRTGERLRQAQPSARLLRLLEP